jgi:hypothetical protein
LFWSRLLTAPPTTAGAWSAAAAHMDPAGGPCARSQDVQIEQFGQKFASIFCELNDTCRQFFALISNRIFTNEEEWQKTLRHFK